MTKWEYRTVTFDASWGYWPFAAGGDVAADEISAKLNQLGRQGWELVTAIDTNDVRGKTRVVVCILKRPVPPDQP
jgi:hypothetical protein